MSQTASARMKNGIAGSEGKPKVHTEKIKETINYVNRKDCCIAERGHRLEQQAGGGKTNGQPGYTYPESV